MKKVTLTIIVTDDSEAQIVASQMTSSMIAQEGFFTLECGGISDLTQSDKDSLFDQVDLETLLLSYYLDKNEEPIEEGVNVDVDKTDDNEEFRGTVTGYRNEFVVIEDQDGNSFCVLPENIEID